jgi:hypothetical protein
MKKPWIFQRVSLRPHRDDGGLDLRPWRSNAEAAVLAEPELPRREFLRHSAFAASGLGLAGMAGTFGLSWLFERSASAATVVPTGNVVIRADETIIRSRRELIMFHGQSNAMGTGGRTAHKFQQIYANVNFKG